MIRDGDGMSRLNQVFFNEYSKLDKLCRELYHKLPDDEIKGVTNYINDMKNTPSHISRTVTDWDECLHALIHIRHIRNQLAHEPGAFEEIDCTQNDIDWVHYFHRSIMEHTDPISQARKNIQKANSAPQKSAPKNNYYYENHGRRPEKKKRSARSFLEFLLWAGVTLGISGILIYFFNELFSIF